MPDTINVKAGDRVIVGGEKAAIVTMTERYGDQDPHQLHYRTLGGVGGVASASICRKVSAKDEEWVALVLAQK